MDTIKNLEWRYATKKFDNLKKIEPENIKKIQHAVQLSASSYGLQLYKILFIEDANIRVKLRKVSFDQPQITDASHLVVFCNYTKVSDNDIDKYLKLIAETRKVDLDSLSSYGDMMKGSINSKPEQAVQEWTARQTYIALGTLLSATAEMQIDSCPMEGFDSQMYNEILGLNNQSLNAAVIATIGYRSSEDKYQHLEKVRKPIVELFKNI